MNELFISLGLPAWKPVLAALVLPPVPLLLLALVGARMMFWRRGVAWLVILLAIAALWLSSTVAVGEWLVRTLVRPPAALDLAHEADALRDAAVRRGTAVIVLGGGREPRAPEYGLSSLNGASLERLRYGLWLGRELGVPVGFTGGTGHAQTDGPPEAEVAARIAAREFGRPLRWVETQSRDTIENARYTLALLKDEGVRRLIVVSHGWHLPRAQRAFEVAVRHTGQDIQIVPAPMGMAPIPDRPVLRWLPSHEGFKLSRVALRECLGLLMGA